MVLPGTRVEVRSRFEDHWSRGFEISEVVNNDGRDRYKVRRRSDGSVLPVTASHVLEVNRMVEALKPKEQRL